VTNREPDDERKWARCANLVETRIRSGAYLEGEWLPTLEQLADETGASTGTVVKALRVLQNEGLVSKIYGRGYYVGTGNPDRKTAELLPELIRAMSPDDMSRVLMVLADQHPIVLLRAIRYSETLTPDNARAIAQET
jgi:DNA-binding GntR family transcriptional regulator